MSSQRMTSMERVLTALSHREPDRVPFFLFPVLHGARELGLSIRDYFSRAQNVAEGQLRQRARYGHDCLYAFFHAPLELEAFGGEVLFRDDGPPNAGEPIIKEFSDIERLESPRIETCPGLQRVLDAIRIMAESSRGEVPIIGVVMSPFSLPVMQMGFDRYLDLIHERRDLFDRLMAVNEEFCTAWASAQCAAGANAICYFDPVSSPTIVPYALFNETGRRTAQRIKARLAAPIALHLASGRALALIDDLVALGIAAVGVSCSDELAQLKQAARGRIGLLGNLNGIEMRRWTPAETEQQVRHAIRIAGPGGGFILADNHGEIPWQVSEDTLMAISETVHRWGGYPLVEGSST